MPPKARKSVVLMVTNVGSSSLELNSLGESFLDRAKYAMKVVVEKKIFLQPKDEIGIITMGDETNNPYDVDYVNIYKENLLVPNWEMVKYINDLKATKKPCNWIEGLHVVLSYIKQEVVDPNFNVFLVLFNNFKEDDKSINEYDADIIADELKNYHLNFIFVGEKTGEELLSDCTASEQFMLDIISQLDTEQKPQYENLNSFTEKRRFYNVPATNPMAWKFDLELGNLCIPCSEYIKASDDSKLDGWQLTDADADDSSEDAEKVKVVKEKVILDQHRNEVPQEDIISGYQFGGKYITCNDEDEAAMKYSGSEKGMMIYGFVPRDEVKLEYWSGNASRIVLPETTDNSEAFYSLLHAMVESKVAAIVRKVYANNYLPKMGVLFPKVDDDEIWCFVHIELPFAEDIRYIDKKPIQSIENLMSKEKLDALDEFIDSMTIADNEIDYLNPGKFPNVEQQYWWNAIADRALNPDGPLLPLNEYIKQYLIPPEDLRVKVKFSFKKLDEAFKDWNMGEEEDRKPKKSAAVKNDIELDKPKPEVVTNENDFDDELIEAFFEDDFEQNEKKTFKAKVKPLQVEELDDM